MSIITVVYPTSNNSSSNNLNITTVELLQFQSFKVKPLGRKYKSKNTDVTGMPNILPSPLSSISHKHKAKPKPKADI